MKKKLTIITICLIIILMLGICFSNISNAAIESKPGATAHTTTPSTSYQYCYDMRSSTSTLGNNSLDPHLTLNKDYGAVVYLGASAYGRIRENKGNQFKMNDLYYWSTTNNITGIMNLGIEMYGTNGNNTESKTVTAWIPTNSETDSNSNYKNLFTNKDTKYVEVLSSFEKEDTIGMALGETKGWYNKNPSYNTDINTYYNYRLGYFDAGNTQNYYVSWGLKYHAAIWN